MNSTDKMREKVISIVAGGTAGHVFPAQALSQILSTKNKILFFTDKRGSKYFDDETKITKLNISNISGSKKVLSLFKLGIATLKCIFLLKTKKVRLAIGFGGLTSFPVLFSAKLLKIPIIIHEQNSVLGKANKFFARDAQLIATSYSETKGTENLDKVIYTGNPIRSSIFYSKRRRTRITNEIYIVVIGGSQGAKIMDEVVARAITLLPANVQENISIWQQVRDENAIKGIYETSKVRNFSLSNFFQDAPQLIANSDLVITRAGASALAEIEHLNVPSIIIPMALSADNHQYHNAVHHIEKGIGVMLEEKELSVENLLSKLNDLLVRNKLEQIRNVNCRENSSAQKLAVKVNEVIINLRL